MGLYTCKLCGRDSILHAERDCVDCRRTIGGVNDRNADHVLKACLEALKITGPTAEMFLRRAKRVADEARSQA